MTPEEGELVEHYDRYLDSYTPLKHVGVDLLADLVSVPLVGPGLDLACGTGRLAYTAPGPLDGIDISSTRVEAARKRHLYRTVAVGDVYELVEADAASIDRYATIYAIEVFEHLANPWPVIRGALRFLQPAGHMLGTVPLRMPGKGHFTVFDSVDHAVTALLADDGELHTGRFPHAVLRWDAPTTEQENE